MAGVSGPHSANSPRNLSRSLDKILADAQLTCELKLSGRKLKEYPKGALKYDLSDTVVADLSKNRFSEIPNEVTEYTSLEQLNLYQNVIKHLSESVIALQSLTHLILSRNQLSVVPGCVCALSALRVLDLSGNRLVSLPEEVGQLQNLMDLDASYNQLAHLPPALGELDNLRRLNLRRNLLQTLPPELCFLRLVFLDLSGNRVTTLPTELRFMSSLVTLALDNNPLQQPPANLCTRGRVHIFKWLEMTAAKEDKKRGVLSESEFRKLRKPSSCTDFRFVNGLFDPRHKRSTMDSGYSTSENGDQRWSQESQESLEYEDPRKFAVMVAACTKEQRQERGRSGGPSSSRPVSGLTNGGTSAGVNVAQGANGSAYGTPHNLDNSTSGLSTPSTLSPGEGFAGSLEDEFNKAMKLRQDYENVYNHDNSPVKESQSVSGAIWNAGSGSHSSSSSNSSNHSNSSNGGISLRHPPEPPHPPNHDPGGGFIPPNHPSSSHNPRIHVPTYREYVEAKLQRRALENNNIYRRQGDGSAPVSENGTHSHRSVENLTHRTDVPSYPRPNPMGASKPPCNGSRVSPSKGSAPNSPEVSFDSGDGPSYPSTVHPNSSLPTSLQQTAVPHTNYSSSLYNSQTLNYPVNVSQLVTTSYPMNGSGTHPYTNSSHQTSHLGPGTHGSTIGHQTNTSANNTNTYNSRSSGNSLPKTPSAVKARNRSGGGRPFDPDSSPAHMSFTYRRELEKQQHEKQLIDNLRNIIETRLKVSLPADLPAALMDGVVLCHLANHVRPRSVSSIHVPSPAVPKLTIAKCRLNVENFLEACRKIGVEEACVCACEDIVTQFDPERVLTTVRSLVNPSESLSLYKSNGMVLDHHPEPLDPSVAILEEPQTSLWDTKTTVHSQPFQQADHRLLSNALLCIFLSTLVLLYWYPPPDE
ncbi:DISP complex protein LRCH3-like isoform X2 [Macrobrachium nipponense]|uniref:DISP complex protein LRCH3-like isoform X2 n=1 Tax=Macrobrachium nipponense TaxID=159736 RepID=UPI0030C862B4